MTTQPLQRSETTAPVPPARRKATLLIVDDEEGPRQALRVIFGNDYEVLLAEDGFAAIELAQTRPIDVAILDIRMAGMSGIDVLERIRFVEPAIGVVMMTAYETTETLRQAMRLSASDYISKPFDIATMRAAVTRALEHRSGSMEARTSVEKVAQLKTELHQQKLDEEVLRARGDIYASVLHDMNGPLTIISGLTQLINQRLAEKDSITGEDLEATKDHLQRITRQVTNCAEISRRYLSFLRQNPNDNLRVSVNEILGDINELLRFHPAVKNHDLSIQRMLQDVAAAISGTDLIQILLNLTVNALQCTADQHRVEVSAEGLEGPLKVELLQDGPSDRYINLEVLAGVSPVVALRVQDNGPGMTPEILNQLFEAYFTTKPRGQGTGLGLCIVQRLIKEAQGAIHVHSAAGKGTTLTVYLPARANMHH